MLDLPARDWTGRVVVLVRPEADPARESARHGLDPDFDGPGTSLFATCLDRGIAQLTIAPLGSHLDPRAGADGEAPGHLTAPVDAGRHGRYVGYTHAYNRTTLAWRVHDVLTAVGYARDLGGSTPGAGVRLCGFGEAGTWTLLARALAGSAVERTYAQWPEAPIAPTAFDDPDFVPGSERYGLFLRELHERPARGLGPLLLASWDPARASFLTVAEPEGAGPDGH